ncbi:P-loop NTPase family protein [Vallitalea okinawensis]|uniref:hypothetical protein n=1 Tax=Vallitalea okinawensis TaxID=2078660 RepID=UPI000CFA87E0|nr:hypothetical protein [Vallitalea okinawensis]
MAITLVILDKDPSYSEYLTHYFRRYYNSIFHIVSSTTLVAMNIYLQNNDCIFLIHESYREDWSNEDAEVFWLCEEKNNGERFLYKYQKVDRFIHKILETSQREVDNLSLLKGLKQNIIGIYSPIGGIGKTTIATALTGLIAQHENVLYLNLEPFPSNAFLMNEGNKYNFSDLLLFASRASEDINMLIEKVVNRYETLELYYFNPYNRYEDLLDTDAGTWYRLMLALCHKYDKIILDFGSHEDKQVLTVFNLCHVLVVLVCHEPFAKMKVEKWYNYQQKMSRDLNICWVANKIDQREESQEPSSEYVLELAYNESYLRFNNFEELLRSSLLDKLIPLYLYLEGGESVD